MSTTPTIDRIPGPLTLHIERDGLDSDHDEIKILGEDWQGTFTIATFTHRYAPKQIEATAQLMSASEEIAAALQLAVRTLELEHAKNNGQEAARIWYALQQARAACKKAGL